MKQRILLYNKKSLNCNRLFLLPTVSFRINFWVTVRLLLSFWKKPSNWVFSSSPPNFPPLPRLEVHVDAGRRARAVLGWFFQQQLFVVFFKLTYSGFFSMLHLKFSTLTLTFIFKILKIMMPLRKVLWFFG